MKQSANYKMDLPEGNNIVDIDIFNQNISRLIDKGLTLDVGISTGTGNNYILDIGSITLSESNRGISFKFWSDRDSNGAVTINSDYKLIKAGGSPIKNIKKNAPYVITYDGGSNFFLASGADESDSTSVGTDGSNVLYPNTFIGSDGEVHQGSMKTINVPNTTLNCGGSVIIAKGFHPGTERVTANSLATQMANNGVTLTSASQLISGVKAYSKTGQLLTGSATIASLNGLNKKTFNISYTKGSTVHISSDFTPKIILIENYQYLYHRVYIYVDFSKYISNADTEYISNTTLSESALKEIISNVSSTGFDLTLPDSETSISKTTVYNIRGIMIS